MGTVRFGGVTMASVYGFRITVTGKGGHGSTPENCVDPIVTAVKIHEALETLMSREKSPFAEAVLAIGKFQAGDAANVIPEQAVLEGTLRAFDPVQRVFLVERIVQIAPAVAATYRATARMETLTDVPELRNDDALVRECLAAATAATPTRTRWATCTRWARRTSPSLPNASPPPTSCSAPELTAKRGSPLIAWRMAILLRASRHAVRKCSPLRPLLRLVSVESWIRFRRPMARSATIPRACASTRTTCPKPPPSTPPAL